MGNAKSQPSEFELQVLGVLWDHGASTVREVMEHLPDGKPRAYTSVLSVMQVMQKKKLLKSKRQKDGLAYVFSPTSTREQIVGPLLDGLVSRVFGGSAAMAVQQLLTQKSVESEDLDSIRKFIDQIEDERSGNKD
jgi:BlaI family transcriptional regulator, penicillinase repressor